jgi:predicted metalloenzyme YecM
MKSSTSYFNDSEEFIYPDNNIYHINTWEHASFPFPVTLDQFNQ